MAAPGWYPDPLGRFEQRYFDGSTWTSAVSRAGQQFVDPPTRGSAGPAASPWQAQAAWQPHTSQQSHVPQHGHGSQPARLSTDIPFSEMSSEGPPASRPTALIVGILVGVVALAGAVFLVTNSGGDDDARPNDDTPASVSAPTSDNGATEVTAIDFIDAPDGQPVTVSGAPLAAFEGDNDPMVGTIAPSLVGSSFTGEPVVIDGRQSGPTMVVFLAHWCPHCNAEIPRLLEWKASGAVPANLQVIGVSTAVAVAGENYPPAEWLAAKGWSWPVMADQSTGQGDGSAGVAALAMGATGWPFFVILGSDNQVLARGSGEKDIDQLSQLVADALALDTGPTAPVKPTVSLPATPPTELMVTTLIPGTGPAIAVGDTVTAHYVGVTINDGVEFDNSYDRGQPLMVTIGVGQLIEGWDLGLIGLQAGGRYQLDIPSELAYGDDAAASGRPAGPLTFVIDIISTTPA